MTISAQTAASAIDFTSIPSACALATEDESGRNPTQISATPLSRKFSVCAWP